MPAFDLSAAIMIGVVIAVGALVYALVFRWLIVIVPAIVLAGFAFEPDAQIRFTFTLLGWLALLYLAPAVLLCGLSGITHRRLARNMTEHEPTAVELAQKILAEDERRRSAWDQDDEARDADRAKAEARDRRERATRQAKDLEMQGAFTMWRRHQ